MRQKQRKISETALFSISFKLKPNYFSINSKIFFQERTCNYLLHSTTNNSFSFHLCPMGNAVAHSVRNISSSNICSKSLNWFIYKESQ